jgi:ADP-heptose:LPS heptosyltransferase
MATGIARGAKKRGKRIAFGDGKHIIWDHHSQDIFAHNVNIARPGCESHSDLEWVPFYKGNRIYNTQGDGRWIWNMDFRATPGEVIFNHSEQRAANRFGRDFVLIEPNVPHWKSVAQNKDWGFGRYEEVAKRLRRAGVRVVQFNYGLNRPLLTGVQPVTTRSFRDALAILGRAKLYVGPEGGLHHGAAALGVPGVVIFGGFIPPQVTGYASHVNLTGGAEACGSFKPCQHCRDAMAKIKVEEVVDASLGKLRKKVA